MLAQAAWSPLALRQQTAQPFMCETVPRLCTLQVPRPHVSVGWVLSDGCSTVEAAVAKLNAEAAQQLEAPSLTVMVRCLMNVVC